MCTFFIDYVYTDTSICPYVVSLHNVTGLFLQLKQPGNRNSVRFISKQSPNTEDRSKGVHQLSSSVMIRIQISGELPHVQFKYI